MFPEDQIAELKELCPDISQAMEGDKVYLLIPELHLPEGCTPSLVEALLCPTPRDGYESRLFFAQKVESRKSLNWNAINVRILEKNWFAYSYKVRAGLSLIQMVAAHLGAFK